MSDETLFSDALAIPDPVVASHVNTFPAMRTLVGAGGAVLSLYLGIRGVSHPLLVDGTVRQPPSFPCLVGILPGRCSLPSENRTGHTPRSGLTCMTLRRTRVDERPTPRRAFTPAPRPYS